MATSTHCANPSELLILGLNASARGRKGCNPKTVTEEQAAAMQQKAIDFLDRMNADDPNDIAGMTVGEYAEHKHLKLSNPGGFQAGWDKAKPEYRARVLKAAKQSESHAAKAFKDIPKAVKRVLMGKAPNAFVTSREKAAFVAGLTAGGKDLGSALTKLRGKKATRMERLTRSGLGRNPAHLKPVEDITDRAKRYRAQKNISPKKARRCELCGSKRNLVVDHRDGNEGNGRPSNLRWLCTSCNNREGHKKIKAGKGVRLNRYNPGAETLGSYVSAAVEHRRGERDAGGAVIHATPKDRRSKFAKQIWKIRRKRGNPGEDGALAAGKDLYRKFHGKEPKEIADLAILNEVQRTYVYGGEFFRARFLMDDGHELLIRFDDDEVKLASSPKGDQLYCIGGNQDVLQILADYGLDTSKDLIAMGRWYCVYYIAAKGITNFVLTEWEHYFGCREEIDALIKQSEAAGWDNARFQAEVKKAMDAVPSLERDLPEAIYDKLNKRILWAGGSYYVDWPGIIG